MSDVATPVGRTPADRDSLLQAVALTEAHLVDDVGAIAVLTGHLSDGDKAGLVIGLVVMLEALEVREPGSVRALLVDTRAANARSVGGGE